MFFNFFLIFTGKQFNLLLFLFSNLFFSFSYFIKNLKNDKKNLINYLLNFSILFYHLIIINFQKKPTFCQVAPGSPQRPPPACSQTAAVAVAKSWRIVCRKCSWCAAGMIVVGFGCLVMPQIGRQMSWRSSGWEGTAGSSH